MREPWGACLCSLEEEIYSVFRPYGIIDDLIINGDATALNAAGVGGGGACRQWTPPIPATPSTAHNLGPALPTTTTTAITTSHQAIAYHMPPPVFCVRDPCRTPTRCLFAGSVQYRSVYSAMIAILCLRGSQLPGGESRAIIAKTPFLGLIPML